MRRTLLVVTLVLLWFPLLWPHPPAPQDPEDLPVQVRLQVDLAGRLLRLADQQPSGLPRGAGEALEEAATSLLDQGLELHPEAPSVVLRRAVLAARADDRAAALALVDRIQVSRRSPAARILGQSWRGGPTVEGADAALKAELTGYFHYLALIQAGQVEAADALLAEHSERARADLATLTLLTVLTAGTLALGMLAWSGLPWLGRLGPARGNAFQVQWRPLEAMLAGAGLQWLAPVMGSPLFHVLLAAGLPLVPAGLTVQLLVYLVSLTLLARLLPHLASPQAASGPLTTLGLGRPSPRHLAAGVAGFWMALPAVLAASWLTSNLLGHSPFSSNPALEMLLQGSPAEVLALGLAAALAAPFFEEVLFRGVLYASLRQTLRPMGAGLVSAALFSLVHGDTQAILALGTLGALFAWLYERTGSLWPAILAHSLWNGGTVAAMVLLRAGT